MAHKLYDNFVLESKLQELLETKLNTRSLMTIDDSLTSAPGVIKKINVYNYTGAVEAVGMGEKNTVRGQVSFIQKQYEVAVSQQVADYHDEEYMQDPKVLDVILAGQSAAMTNDMNSKYFEELKKATLNHQYTGTLKYDDIVDAISLLNVEEETGLFLVIGVDLKAEIRKDPDFKSARQGEILFHGQIGDICGVPVIVSKKVDADMAHLATKKAVTCFIKKESEVEQDRDKERRINTIIGRKVNLVALTDATKTVKLTKKAAKSK